MNKQKLVKNLKVKHPAKDAELPHHSALDLMRKAFFIDNINDAKIERKDKSLQNLD
jgi:hypothetical protein